MPKPKKQSTKSSDELGKTKVKPMSSNKIKKIAATFKKILEEKDDDDRTFFDDIPNSCKLTMEDVRALFFWFGHGECSMNIYIFTFIWVPH